MEKFSLTGKCALVTGGSRGIGFGIASALADAGADIILVSRHQNGLDNAKEQLTKTDRKITTHSFDMNLTDEIEGFFNDIVRETGGIDILVNNAGGLFGERRLSPDGIEMTLALNHLGYFSLTNLLLPMLPKNR